MVDVLSGSTRVMFNGVSTAVCELHHWADSVSGLQGALGGNKQKRTEADLITVEDIVKHHWQEFGRSAAQMVPGQGYPLSKESVFLKLVSQFFALPRWSCSSRGWLRYVQSCARAELKWCCQLLCRNYYTRYGL